MGTTSSIQVDETTSWSKKYGCNHYDDDTFILEFKWKVIPVKSEESCIAHKKVLKMGGRVAIVDPIERKAGCFDHVQEVVQCRYYCNQCQSDKYLTLELWPEKPVMRRGKYTQSISTKDICSLVGCTVEDVMKVYKEVKQCKFKTIDYSSRVTEFCDNVWHQLKV